MPAVQYPVYIDCRECTTQPPGCCVVHHHMLMLVLSCSSFAGCLSPVKLLQERTNSLSYRTQYKLCVLMFGIYHGTASSYMLELCKCCTDSRLRSAAHGNFTIPRTRLRFAYRSFAVAGPKAWNALPSRLRTLTCKDTFHKHMKTHSFNHCFN